MSPPRPPEPTTLPIRTLLYVPGDRPDRIAKALTVNVDAVLVDLEDAVSPSTKPAAREHVVGLLEGVAANVWVRINAGEAGRTDLAVLRAASRPPQGVVLAKCEHPGWIDEVASILPPSVEIVPLIESARALRCLDSLCAHERVHQCHLGEIDLLADLGVDEAAAAPMLAYAYAEVVVASAAAGLHRPIAGVYPDVRDTTGLAEDCTWLASSGFGGRPALHPAQVPIIDHAFRPTAGQIRAARHVLELYEEALRRGVGAVSDDNGKMIDEAVARQARRVLDAAAPRPAAAITDEEGHRVV